ncbi:MAG: substrate-binding domain-containing protein [Pyrinomonadaceae bacterium]
MTRTDSPLKLESVADLARPEFRKIANANPEHAPYGMAAREALQSSQVWETVSPKLVFGENVSQTLQLRGERQRRCSHRDLSLSVHSGGGTNGKRAVSPPSSMLDQDAR